MNEEMLSLAQLEPQEIVPESFLRSCAHETYSRGASSRRTPLHLPFYPEGTWVMEDEHVFLYGREVERLRVVEPAALSVCERMVERNEEGRGDDAHRYAEWWRQGSSPPPVRVIETVRGEWRVIDGHRRVAAARIVGKPVWCWFSPCVSIGEEEPMTQDGPTYEVALIVAYRAKQCDAARLRRALDWVFQRGGRGLYDRYPRVCAELGIDAQCYPMLCGGH